MTDSITPRSLVEMGFKKQEGSTARVYKYDVFNVRLAKDVDSPLIWVDEKLNGGDIPFPGAYTLKDLKDIMFFYYGENEYGDRFGHLQAIIINEQAK